MENRVRMLRLERKLNQGQLGDTVGLSQQTVSRIEQDYNKMTVDTLVRLASYFGVTTDFILGLSEKRLETEISSAKVKELDRFREFYRVYRTLDERDREILYQMGKLMKEKK